MKKDIQMRRYHIILITLLVAIPSFADTYSSKICDVIANACLKTGFGEVTSAGKNIWYDCMKPTLLGKKVAGVTLDPKDVNACRQFKIADLKKLLHELQHASPTNNQ
jgi:hypothetical protein